MAGVMVAEAEEVEPGAAEEVAEEGGGSLAVIAPDPAGSAMTALMRAPRAVKGQAGAGLAAAPPALKLLPAEASARAARDRPCTPAGFENSKLVPTPGTCGPGAPRAPREPRFRLGTWGGGAASAAAAVRAPRGVAPPRRGVSAACPEVTQAS